MEHDEAKNFHRGKKKTRYYDTSLQEAKKLKKKDEKLHPLYKTS